MYYVYCKNSCRDVQIHFLIIILCFPFNRNIISKISLSTTIIMHIVIEIKFFSRGVRLIKKKLNLYTEGFQIFLTVALQQVFINISICKRYVH